MRKGVGEGYKPHVQEPTAFQIVIDHLMERAKDYEESRIIRAFLRQQMKHFENGS